MSKHPSLSKILEKQSKQASKKSKSESGPGVDSHSEKDQLKKEIEDLKLKMLRIQEGIWQRKARAIVVFEGFDAAGKGGCIKQLIEDLDPRGVQVHPIGPPTEIEQGTHWLYRFWTRLPAPGILAVFDRSWYGRVLVERVDHLAHKEAWKRAYREIREFERMLTEDGVDIIKVFLAVSPEEQFERFRERLEDPYKSWKLTMADIEARARWDDYVSAGDDLLRETHVEQAPWRVVPSDRKTRAHLQVLECVTQQFSRHQDWIESQSRKKPDEKEIRKSLKSLKGVK